MTDVTFWRVEDRAEVGIFPTTLKKDEDFPRYKELIEREKITLALSDFPIQIFKEASQWLWNRKTFLCECRKISNAHYKKRLENAAG